MEEIENLENGDVIRFSFLFFSSNSMKIVSFCENLESQRCAKPPATKERRLSFEVSGVVTWSLATDCVPPNGSTPKTQLDWCGKLHQRLQSH